MSYEPFQIHRDELLQLNAWEKDYPGIAAGFTTKKGGFSKGDFSALNLGLHVNDDPGIVRINRDKIAEIVGFPASVWTCSEQVHENRIYEVTSVDKGKGVYSYKEGIPATDGLYTKESGIMLALLYADCVPLYFMAPSHHLIGVAHAGWKGTVKDIAGEMVRAWGEEYDVAPGEILAAVGPSIGSCCYAVDDRVIDQVNQVYPAADGYAYQKIGEGQYSLDLKLLNKLLLIQAGVPQSNITASGYCTSCENSLFFSHRRDQGKTGRMLSYIGYKER